MSELVSQSIDEYEPDARTTQHVAWKAARARLTRHARTIAKKIDPPHKIEQRCELVEKPSDQWVQRQLEIWKERRLLAEKTRDDNGNPTDTDPTVFLSKDNFSQNAIVKIQKIVAAHYDLTRDDIIGTRITADVVIHRHVAMYLARIMTTYSLPEIGRQFGGRDHSTSHYAYHKIVALRKSDAELNATIVQLEATIRGTL